MNIPIIIVHTGDCFYLKQVLRHIKLFNPENDIYLISDASTVKYSSWANHCPVDAYMEKARTFGNVYKHLSPNSYHYELFCFQRWFIILDFVEKMKIDDFVCLDSDILLYCNVNDVFKQYLDYDFTICAKMGPCFTMFHRDSLKQFCTYITSMYTDAHMIDKVKDFYKNLPFGGVCDMTAFSWYPEDVSDNVKDLVYPEEGACFDGNMQDSMGFEMEGRFKKIYWIDDLPHGKFLRSGEYIRFYGLHLQGGAKHKMYKYFLDDNKKRDESVKTRLSWLLSGKRIQSRYKELKKMFSSKDMFVLMLKRKMGIRN